MFFKEILYCLFQYFWIYDLTQIYYQKHRKLNEDKKYN